MLRCGIANKLSNGINQIVQRLFTPECLHQRNWVFRQLQLQRRNGRFGLLFGNYRNRTK